MPFLDVVVGPPIAEGISIMGIGLIGLVLAILGALAAIVIAVVILLIIRNKRK